MSISSSVRSLAFKPPHQIVTFTPNFPLRKIVISPPKKTPSSSPLLKSISFERLSNTKPSNPPQSLPSPLSSSSESIEELPPKLREIVKLFQGVEQFTVKHEQLLFYARHLPPLDDRYKTRENMVKGCVSQVWVRAYLDQDKNVWFEADSDSELTKGLAALLVQGLSGRPVPEIILVSPNFITLLGLQQRLTLSRNNGFFNMLKLMQKKALLLAVEDQKGGEQDDSFSESDIGKTEGNAIEDEIESSSSDSDSGSDNGNGGVLMQKKALLLAVEDQKGGEQDDSFSEPDIAKTEGNAIEDEIESSSSDSDSGSDNGNGGVAFGGRAERIKEKLERELNPMELEVEDVSYQHAGHSGNRTGEDGTHINLRIVSKEFEGKSVVKRHRMIYALLQDELQSGLHALSIVAKAPGEPV